MEIERAATGSGLRYTLPTGIVIGRVPVRALRKELEKMTAGRSILRSKK